MPASLPSEASAPQTNAAEYTVSGLSHAIKRVLEEGFGYVRLRGEISGYRGPHSSGHCYFSLKDDKAKIDAVIWRGVFQRLRIAPQEGLEVVVQGRITTFPNSSKYQIAVDSMEPAGVGALMALLEERKKKLAAEGLFAEARKRPLPFFPTVVGLVTSPTGAVIRDMLHGFNERFPTRVLVWPVRVQGETCPAEVAAAIRGFNALSPGGPIPRPDVLIVARGGGSLEDLWGFNDEGVVRAAAESAIPLISAVGHETDWTLLDLAADARAPTPTKAAEWAVPKHSDLVTRLSELALRAARGGQRLLEGKRALLTAAARGLPTLQEILVLPRQQLDSTGSRLGRALLANTHAHARRFGATSARLAPLLLGRRLERLHRAFDATVHALQDAFRRRTGLFRGHLDRPAARLRPVHLLSGLSRNRERLVNLSNRAREAARNRLEARRRRLDALGKFLVSLSYQSVLERGYALVRNEDGRMLRAAALIGKGDNLDIEFADGHVAVTSRSRPLLHAQRSKAAAETGAPPDPPPPPANPVSAGPAPAKPPRRPRGPRKKNPQGSLL